MLPLISALARRTTEGAPGRPEAPVLLYHSIAGRAAPAAGPALG